MAARNIRRCPGNPEQCDRAATSMGIRWARANAIPIRQVKPSAALRATLISAELT